MLLYHSEEENKRETRVNIEKTVKIMRLFLETPELLKSYGFNSKDRLG